jgi:hypothetical protein
MEHEASQQRHTATTFALENAPVEVTVKTYENLSSTNW